MYLESRLLFIGAVPIFEKYVSHNIRDVNEHRVKKKKILFPNCRNIEQTFDFLVLGTSKAKNASGSALADFRFLFSVKRTTEE